MVSPAAFDVSFKCREQMATLSFNPVAPNHMVVGGFDNLVRIINGQFYTESPAKTAREAGPLVGLSVGTMPVLTKWTGYKPDTYHPYRALAADSNLSNCYRKSRATNGLSPEQDLVVLQFFASAATTFPHDMGIECTSPRHTHHEVKHKEISGARACQAAAEAFWKAPFSVFSFKNPLKVGGILGFSEKSGWIVEPSCSEGFLFNDKEEAEQCQQGRDRMGIPSQVIYFGGKGDKWQVVRK